jgi:hypothetical protein
VGGTEEEAMMYVEETLNVILKSKESMVLTKLKVLKDSEDKYAIVVNEIDSHTLQTQQNIDNYCDDNVDD